MRQPVTDRPIIGWREWVSLPDLHLEAVKAKVDTGARSSSLHARRIQRVTVEGVLSVRFEVRSHPAEDAPFTVVTMPVHDVRTVRSSNGVASERYVIRTQLRLLGHTWAIDVTLANREAMGFRMLLGREALRGRVLVDASRSFLAHPAPPGIDSLSSTQSQS